MMTPVEIAPPRSPADDDAIKALMREYSGSLGFSLAYQDFEREMDDFPGKYAAPDGALLLATVGGKAAGTVALRKLDEGICEMKRLYVAPQARGQHLGQRLVEAVIADAKSIGYRRLYLDTLPEMAAAQRLYARLGFVETGAYVHNPVAGAKFFVLTLV